MPVIIIEGGELVGKTSIIRALQDKIPYHTLIKLSGYPTSTISSTYSRACDVAGQYDLMMPIIEKFARDRIRTLIFDRFCTTEKIMFPTSFSVGNMDIYLDHAAQYGVEQFILTAPDNVLEVRHSERVKSCDLERQQLSSILKVHEQYRREAADTPLITRLVDNDGSKSPSDIALEVIKLANIPLYSITD